jgi:apolipoprotein N-acyltransferase
MSFPRLSAKYLIVGITVLVIVAKLSNTEALSDVSLVVWVLVFYTALIWWIANGS